MWANPRSSNFGETGAGEGLWERLGVGGGGGGGWDEGLPEQQCTLLRFLGQVYLPVYLLHLQQSFNHS